MDRASQVKSEASAIEKLFESEQFWHNEHTKPWKALEFPKAHPSIPILLS